MRTFAITLALGAIAWIGAMPTADARPHHRHVSTHIYVGGYQSCGTPIYYERYIVRHDRRGRPIWGHRRCAAPVRHHRVVTRHRPVVVAPCPPPVYHGRHHHRRAHRSNVHAHIGHGHVSVHFGR